MPISSSWMEPRGGGSVHPIYQALGYNFPRVLMLDVKDCIWVEVDNPLPKALAIPTFWVPNVILSSDYLITVAPLKIFNGKGNLSITNLLSLLPSSKYQDEEYGKIFIGEPYEVDLEVSETLGLNTEHLDLIKSAKVELEP